MTIQCQYQCSKRSPGECWLDSNATYAQGERRRTRVFGGGIATKMVDRKRAHWERMKVKTPLYKHPHIIYMRTHFWNLFSYHIFICFKNSFFKTQNNNNKFHWLRLKWSCAIIPFRTHSMLNVVRQMWGPTENTRLKRRWAARRRRSSTKHGKKKTKCSGQLVGQHIYTRKN